MRRRISASMRAVHSEGVSRQQISASARGKAKTCALCGEAGHNKRTCPLNATSQVGCPNNISGAVEKPPHPVEVKVVECLLPLHVDSVRQFLRASGDPEGFGPLYWQTTDDRLTYSQTAGIKGRKSVEQGLMCIFSSTPDHSQPKWVYPAGLKDLAAVAGASCLLRSPLQVYQLHRVFRLLCSPLQVFQSNCMCPGIFKAGEGYSVCAARGRACLQGCYMGRQQWVLARAGVGRQQGE